MLSTLPKLADKTFIVGFFLPALLFSFACMALFSDYPPLSETILSISQKDNLEKLVYFTLAIWILSTFLVTVNHTQYQVLEGYLWPFNHIARFEAHERDRFALKKMRFDELMNEWGQLDDKFPQEKRDECARLEQELVKNFPLDEKKQEQVPRLLLPTRFGNAIRAFEVYARNVYGADSVALWPHLTTVISKEMKGELDSDKAQVDFLVNICCLAALISLAATIRLIVHVVTWQLPWIDSAKLLSSTTLFFALFIFGGAAISTVAYRWSIQQIHGWGATVKAAFDCHLPELARKLGYRLLDTEKDQKEFWRAISLMAVYHHPVPSGRWPRAQEKDEGKKSVKNGKTEEAEPERSNREEEAPEGI